MPAGDRERGEHQVKGSKHGRGETGKPVLGRAGTGH